jgi:hypothetical protein
MYRASAAGRRRRCDQARRYRQRRREEVRQGEITATTAPQAPRTEVIPEVAQLENSPQCEGQRPASMVEDFVGQPCLRPGCYEVFPIRAGVPQQRYCSCQCRHALRRVLDREARWRRRCHRQRRGRFGRSPPS